MREQKKDRAPAKGNGQIIGNRRTGPSNLLKWGSEYNREHPILAELVNTHISGYSTYRRVFGALESKFEGVQYE